MKNNFYRKKIKTTFLLLLTSILLGSCFSVPVRTIPKVNKEYETTTLGSLTIRCDKLSFNQCNFHNSELLKSLKETNLFTKILFDENVSTDYILTIEPYYRSRYGISHNPMLYLLSIVIPFWEEIEYGYNFTIKDTCRDKIYKITTKESGTNIMWSGSLLINMLPTRGLPITSSNNEVIYLKNTIINTLNR